MVLNAIGDDHQIVPKQEQLSILLNRSKNLTTNLAKPFPRLLNLVLGPRRALPVRVSLPLVTNLVALQTKKNDSIDESPKEKVATVVT